MARTTKTQRLLRGAARWLVTIAVAVSPWLFGSGDPWAYLLVSLVVGMGTAAWLFSLLCSRSPRLLGGELVAAASLLAAFVALQTVPLPIAVLKTLQPCGVSVFEQTASVLDSLGRGPLMSAARNGATAATLSFSTAATQRSLYLAVTYVAAFVVMINTITRWEHLRRVSVMLIVNGFLLAVFGIVQHYSHSYAIYWVQQMYRGANFFGPFTNRNHFGAHMNMLFGVALGVLLSSRHVHEALSWPDWRDRLAWLSSRRASRTMLLVFSLMLMAGSTCLSLSRGAMLSLGISMILFGVLVGTARNMSRTARSAMIALALLVLAGVVWLGYGGRVGARLMTLVDVMANPLADHRAIVTGDTLKIVGACPWFGCGFGAFRHVFPIFQSPALRWRWVHAHNDWAQLLAEGGVLGAFLFAMVCLCWASYIRKRFPGTGDRAGLYVAGVLVGIVTIALHSFVDYSLHKPANALMVAMLAGLGVAGVHLRRRDEQDQDTGIETVDHCAGKRIVLLLTLVVVTAGMAIEWRELGGELAAVRFRYLREAGDLAHGPSALRGVVKQGFIEADIVRRQAERNPGALCDTSEGFLHWARDPRLDRQLRTETAGRATGNSMLAVCGARSDYLPWLWLARSFLVNGQWDQAEICLEQSRRLTRHADEVRMFLPPKLPEESESSGDDRP